MKFSSLVAVGFIALAAAPATAQDPRAFCVGRPDCIPDTLEVELDGQGPVLGLAAFTAGQEVPMQVFTSTQTPRVQGWSYGLRHDTAILSIVADSVTTAGLIVNTATPDAVAFSPNFEVNRAVDGGLISAIVLAFLADTQLPLGERTAILNARYTIDADPGAEGTVLDFVSGVIGPTNSPPTDINFTVDGTSRLPANVIDGVIRIVAGGEDCDNGVDDDGDGLVDCDDPDCADDLVACPPSGCDAPDWALYFGAVGTGEVDVSSAAEAAIVMRNATDAFAFQLGVKHMNGVHSFSGELGADADRIIELVITDDAGDSQTPATPNTARGPAATDVVRGTAIEGFNPGDFFAVDLDPGIGGEGFTVGYVSDLDGDANRIPAVTDGASCGSNHILTVRFGEPTGRSFIRGDADGNGRYNVTDAVLIIQIVLGNLQERFNCDDALDSNDDGRANISDAIPVLMYMFQRGLPLPNPFLQCGRDTTPSKLTCVEDSPACAG